MSERSGAPDGAFGMKKNRIQGMAPPMNKIEALNEKALEAAAKALIDRDQTISGYHPSHIEAKKADAEEAVRAYLTASDAEREPVAWQRRRLFPDKHTREKPQWQDCLAMEVKSWPQHDYQYRPLYAAPLPLTDLEAENARLKAEVERLRELASELPILKYAMPAIKARLAEALKALEPFASVAPVFDHQRIPSPCEDHHTVYRWATKGTGEVEITVADFRAARRVREGGKVDG